MIIKTGDTGPNVRELQTDLDRWGYELGEIDGDFGPCTEGAVRSFQMAQGLKPDGVAGQKTIAILEDGPVGIDQGSAVSVTLRGVPAVAAAAVAFALGDLGAAESPNGSNEGPAIGHLVDGYREIWGIPLEGRSPAWCAMAVCVWTARALGLGKRGDVINWGEHPFGHWRGSTVSSDPAHFSLLDWARENDRLLPADGEAPVGSILIMAREGSGSDLSAGSTSGHVSIVIEDLGERVKTVDGNVSNRVKIVTRPKGDVLGFIRWW